MFRYVLVRSVAVVASGRTGNVTSVFMDEPEVCRRCGANGSVDGGPDGLFGTEAVPLCFASCNHTTKPVSQL